MKKLLSVLLSVAMLLTLAMPAMAAPTEPDEQPDRTLSAQITAEGGTLTLNLTATQPINNGSLTLTYPDGLQLVSASSPAGSSGVSTVNTATAGSITAVWASTGEGESTVLTAVFSGEEGTYCFHIAPGNLYNGAEKVDAQAFDVEGSIPHNCPSAAFTDVDTSRWYHSAVDFAVSSGLMAGISETEFSPNSVLDRATVVTVLYRLAGRPTVQQKADFADVAAGRWYTNAISWAAANGIAYGYEDNTFRPGKAVTRQDTAAFLYRYAEQNDYNSNDLISLDTFPDADQVSKYAVQAMTWAVSNGIITGIAEHSQVVLGAKREGTRAQYARMIMLLENLKPEQITEYTVTFQTEHAAALVNGQPTENVTVRAGEELSFTVSVAEGYELVGVTAGTQPLQPNEAGVYTVQVDADLTIGVLAVEQEVPPTPATYRLTLVGENLDFYHEGDLTHEITVQEGTKYVTFNALGQTGYHPTTATATNGASITNVQNLFVVSNITADTTVQVDSARNTYTVNFSYPYSNTYKIAAQQVMHGQTAVDPGNFPQPERVGKHLTGWYANAAMTTPFDFATPIIGDTTLYSTWADNVYTVTFHSNGGSEIEPAHVVHGRTIDQPANPTHPDGYAFAGWFTDAALTSAFKFNTPVCADTDLYAAWFNGTFEDVYLDGKNGDNENSGTTPAEAVKTFDRARELLAGSKTGCIRVLNPVTIPAGTEESWTLGDISDAAYLVRDSSNAGCIVQVNGTLNLENITLKGCTEEKMSGYMIQVGKGATVNIEDGTLLTDNTTTTGYSCIYIGGGTVHMNGGTIRNMTTTANTAYGAVYLGSTSTNKTNSAFYMNGGLIENCRATGTNPFSAGFYATSAVSSTYSAIATLCFNGGKIVNCGGENARSGACYDNSVNNSIAFQGTVFEDCESVNAMILLNSAAQLRAGTFRATERSKGRAICIYNTSAVRLCPEAEGALRIDGTVFQNNTATVDRPIIAEAPLSTVGGSMKFELALLRPGAVPVTGCNAYTLTKEDLAAFHMANDLQGIYLQALRDNAIVLEKAVAADAAIYLDGKNGSDANDGLSEQTAVATFAKAKQLLQENAVAGGRNWIYIVNTVYITGEETWSLAGIDGARVMRGDTFQSGYMVVLSNGNASYEEPGYLTLENITIDGNKFYNMVAASSMFRVNYGTLTINDGTVLCNAGNHGTAASNGAAIYISSKSEQLYGTVILNGGKITGNYARTSGAVYLTGAYSRLILNGGEISGNEAPQGAGIQDKNGGTVRLSGGTVKDNVCDAALNPYTADICYGNALYNAETAHTLYLSPQFDLPGNALALEVDFFLTLEQSLATREPLTILVRGKAVDGTVVVKGEGYTLTEADMHKLICANEGFTFALDAQNNQIILRQTA